MPRSFALQLYSVRDLYKEDFAACIKKVADMGYKGVECFGAPSQPATTVRALLDAHGLALVGWHLGIDLLEGDQQASTIQYLLDVGCTRAIVPYFDPEAFTSRDSILAFARRMTVVQHALAPHGIALGYHNHGFEFVPLADGTLPFVLLMDSTSLIAQLDSGNALSSKTDGIDPVALVSRFPGRAKTIHAKPYAKSKGFETMIGEDDTDWAAFLHAAETIGGAEWIIVEYEEDHVYEQFDGAERCLRALEAVR